MIDYEQLPVRYILCADAKSFFASVEAVRRGLDPMKVYLVVVSSLSNEGSVILASSPKVKREYGIQTGNRLFEVRDRSKILLVEPSMSLYMEYNQKINQIFKDYVAPEDLLIYSIDESFMDVTSTRCLFGDPWQIAETIKNRIKEELGIVVSIGIGDNPLLAKLALDNRAKKTYNQIAYWSYESIPHTVWKIPKLRDFWGISRGYEEKLKSLGIGSIYELAHYDKNILQRRFGIMGLQLYYHANGVDYTQISQRIPPKTNSYTKGQVLMKDYTEQREILGILMEITEDLAQRLRKNHRLCQEVGLYIRYGYSDGGGAMAKTKKIIPTSSTQELKKIFTQLFLDHWKGESVRQFNVSCGRLMGDNLQQLDIMSLYSGDKRPSVDEIMDNIREQFGKISVFRGYHLLEASTFFERAAKVGGHTGSTEVNGIVSMEKTKGI